MPPDALNSSASAFISHSSADHPAAERLTHFWNPVGCAAGLPRAILVPGQPYGGECVRGIEETSSFVLLASASAIASGQVLSEVEQAHKRRRPIYTILIGRPSINRELDYYISRLHWIEQGGNSLESVAEKLTRVLVGDAQWSEVAPPPSLRRTVLYRRDAFAGAAIGTVVVILFAGVALTYWAHRKISTDFRSLAHVTLSAEVAPAMANNQPSTQVSARVWLDAPKVRFGDLKFLTAARERDNTIERADHSEWTDLDQIGETQVIQFALPRDASHLTTCLIVPGEDFHTQYRVTQEFSVHNQKVSTDDEVVIDRAAEEKVSREDGSVCGASRH